MIHKIVGYALLVFAGMVLMVGGQSMMVFPSPYDFDLNVHPLYAFDGWVYVVVYAVSVAIAISYLTWKRSSK